MTESEFTDLLDRFENGRCTAQEQALLQKWFDAHDPRITPFNNEADKQRTLVLLREAVYHKAGLNQHRRRLGTFILKIAASLLLLAAVGYGVYIYAPGTTTTGQSLMVASATDSIRKIILPDGTLVWLKRNSTLTYPPVFTGQQRPVALHGEALFEVEKDPQHPFIVTCDDLTTTVLGTSFNIRSGTDDVEVIVLTGRVSLHTGDVNTALVVKPEEKGSYSKNDGDLVKKASTAADTHRVTAGTEYDMYFEDTRMQEVLQRIAQKFNVTINAATPRVNNCLITADLTDQSLRKTLDIISTITPIRYDLNNNTITLTGPGCNHPNP